MFYTIVLTLHNILRWVVLIAALLTIIRSVNGLRFKRGWTESDNKSSMLYASFLDVQLLLGLLLYFVLSPITTAALQNFGGAMSNSGARFFLIEHSLMMFIAVVVAHVGRTMVKRAANAVSKHRRNAIWMAISLLIVLASIPWPFFPAARPLFRFFGLF